MNEMTSFFTTLVNASFPGDGLFPSTQKCVVVTLALKKSTLDQFELSNYRPIYNLTSVSNAVPEQIVARMVCISAFPLD